MATNEASQQANRSGMDPRRLVVIFYLVSALILSQFFEHLLASLWGQLGWPDKEVVEGLAWHTTTLVGLGIAVATAVAAYLNPITHRLSLEVASELMKVTWPTFADVRNSTFAVVVASLVAAAILFGIDRLALQIMVEWLPTLWGKL